MKLWIAVAAPIIASFAFAADVVWETGTPPLQPYRHDQPRVPLSKTFGVTSSNPQTSSSNPQQNPQNVSSSTRPQPPANSSQTGTSGPDSQKEEELQIAREANKIARDTISSGWWLGVVQIVLIIAQFGVAAAALYYAKVAAHAAQEATIIAHQGVAVARDEMKIANRAYLSVKKWEVTIDPRTKTRIVGRVYNAGHTPATLVKRYSTIHVGAEPPPPLTPLSLRDVGRTETPLGAQGEALLYMDSIPMSPDIVTGLRAEIAFLYVMACFIYSDVFGQQYYVVSTGRYDIESDITILLEEDGYNCTKEYKEEDWKDEERA